MPPDRSPTLPHHRLALAALALALACAPAASRAAAVAASPPRIVAELHEAPPGQGIWDYAAIDAAHGRLLVGRLDGVEAWPLDGQSPPAMLATGHHVHAVLPLPDGRLLFTNGDSGTIETVDADTGWVLAVLPEGPHPDGAIADPVGHAALVMDGERGTITRVEIGRGAPRIQGTIAVGGKLEAAAVVGANIAMVNVEDHNVVALVSLRGAGRLRQLIALPGCEAPGGLAFEPSTGSVVSACANGVAVVLDAAGTVRATLPIGPHPDAVIADPAHHRVFVPSGGGGGTLAEIALDGTPRVARVWTTRPGARTGAYDPATGRIYLPYGATTRDAQGHKLLVPGSFGVLVLDVT